MERKEVFRLSAILYADNNYEVKPARIIKKIIETALLDCDNSSTNIDDLSSIIESKYKLEFSPEEIIEIIENDKDDHFIRVKKDDTDFVCLHEKRKIVLLAKVQEKTIDHYISLFQQEFYPEDASTSELIYQFIYSLLNNNINEFSSYLNTASKKEVDLKGEQYSEEEKLKINSFLKWDNEEKNKAVFDVASYALEYCMISKDHEKYSVHLKELRNKEFYLDTNVIFRALGLNGENRKKRALNFLKKLKESQENLLVSKFTYTELKETIAANIDKLKERPVRNRVNPEILNLPYLNRNSQFNVAYYNWRSGKANDSLNLFEAHIITQYKTLTKEFGIIEDYKIPFDDKDDVTSTYLKSLAGEIGSHKENEGKKHNNTGDFNDACNIHLIERRRDGRNRNLFDTRYFLISTDQSLRWWDYYRNSDTPILLLPSQWLSIILRYVNRTNDDFTSFVSFLNLRVTEKQIRPESIEAVIQGISEITEDYSHQKTIAETLIQQSFDGLLDGHKDADEIYEEVKRNSENILSEQLNSLEEQHTELSDNVQQLTDSVAQLSKEKTDAEQEATSTLAEKDSEIKAAEEKVEKLADVIKELKTEQKLKRWRILSSIPWVLAAILLIAFYILEFCLQDKEWNIVKDFVEYTDSQQSETRKDGLKWLVNGAGVGLLVLSIKKLYSRTFDKKYLKEKKEEIRREQ